MRFSEPDPPSDLAVMYRRQPRCGSRHANDGAAPRSLTLDSGGEFDGRAMESCAIQKDVHNSRGGQKFFSTCQAIIIAVVFHSTHPTNKKLTFLRSR